MGLNSIQGEINMEIIIGIIVVAIGAALYFNRKTTKAEVEEAGVAPYKVPEPVTTTVVEPTPAVAAQPVVEEVKSAPAKITKAKAKAPAKPKAPKAPKAATPKAEPKPKAAAKPRATKKPKAE